MPVVDVERAYLKEIARRLSAILGEALVGVYAGGSYALGGYEPGRSDLDVAVVVREPLAEGIAAGVLAAHGVAVVGPPAREVFASPPKEALLPVLAQGLRWYRENEAESDDALLN